MIKQNTKAHCKLDPGLKVLTPKFGTFHVHKKSAPETQPSPDLKEKIQNITPSFKYNMSFKSQSSDKGKDFLKTDAISAKPQKKILIAKKLNIKQGFFKPTKEEKE